VGSRQDKARDAHVALVDKPLTKGLPSNDTALPQNKDRLNENAARKEKEKK
jgi:hypothetical protein